MSIERDDLPPRFFNTTGPCDPERHYMLPPKERLIDTNLDRLVTNQLYWVLHAPRQTGKTTFLMSWAKELNAAGRVVACYVSVETCQAVPEPEIAMPAIIDAMQYRAEQQGLPIPPKPAADLPAQRWLAECLKQWAKLCAPRPLVLLFDEVDVLEGPTLVAFLRQLRDGFAGRAVGVFPTSIALVGMRDLRDYLVRSKDGKPLNPGSPFNIKQQSSSIGCFSRADVHRLFAQRTSERGQTIDENALDLIYDLTRGQPWLVNALFQKCIWDLTDDDPTIHLSVDHIQQAKERLILKRAVHIDSLAERLKDPRVQGVIEPIITGAVIPDLASTDAFRLCQDLGLVSLEGGTPQIANPIYREVLARSLSYSMQLGIPAPEFRWQTDDNDLDLQALLTEFQTFWRWNSEAWEERADYTEAFPHLLVMAFLQRIVNGGGRIEREYAAGRGRVDLTVFWQDRIHVIEIKLVHPGKGPDASQAEGLQQLARYADRLHATSRCLVLFDRRTEARARSWEQRLSQETLPDASGQPVLVVRA
jgi:hypothetical protein